MIRKKICIVATSPFPILVFMREHVLQLSKTYHITLICSGDGSELTSMLSSEVLFISLEIERKVSLLSDFLALFSLVRLFKQQRFDCVHSLMPKSALLSMLAARITNVPRRIHIFTGQVWFTKTGTARFFLKFLDKLLSWCATHILADSPSQRAFLISENVIAPDKISVLANGSISGVDVTRFRFDAYQRKRIRSELGITDTSVVFLYLARLTQAKGIVDLTNSFFGVWGDMLDAHLVVVGPDEEGLAITLKDRWESCDGRVHWVDYTDRPEDYMAAADVFCLPSHREGFSLATIQAAGVGLPAIVSRIYGLTDAVRENVTGIFHKAGEVLEIQAAMKLLFCDANLRKEMGVAAQDRAYKEFSQDSLVEAMALFYEKLFADLVETVN